MPSPFFSMNHDSGIEEGLQRGFTGDGTGADDGMDGKKIGTVIVSAGRGSLLLG